MSQVLTSVVSTQDLTKSTLSVPVLESKPLSEQVTEYLYKLLVTGELKGGQRVNEAELARTLKISRNPVREAIRKLEERGLLISSPRRGTFVRSFSASDIQDIFTFRIALEEFAIRQAFSLLTDEDVESLTLIVRQMEAAARAGHEMELVERDIAFHQRICELSRNTQTIRAFSNIYAEIQISISLVEHKFDNLVEAAIDHWPIIDAFRARDEEKIIESVRYHIRDSWKRINEAYNY
ncbi:MULTISPECIES: GntR family transcriptional regulator [Pseudomonas]|uniref:GntR family transcriptional regulator n=1 Tax=Pseudomonas TaxID=286 RepID=UPI0009B60CB2|nr:MULTISPECIES: GntR family transcriptional regulator [Pseudomonas]AYN98107.1 GntR family transcriptional regulator [Pseudomonas sp. LTGT-11-2Z]MDH0572769.1 GntR family transcriptional regulator [Pseudomonas fulva]PIK78830.1 GntR family transcriptional regulator [Pseudomonas sp. 382]